MSAIKARLEHPQRTVELEPDSAILIADGKVHAACKGEIEAFDLWFAFTEWLSRPEVTNPSARWQVYLVALAHGRNAKQQSKLREAMPDYTSATTVLELAKEVLGPDAFAKLRQAMVDGMLGR